MAASSFGTSKKRLRNSWTTLHKHEDDDSLKVEPFSVASWNIEPTKESLVPYRFFRIRSTGPNASGGDNLRLACAGIELYGTLTEENTALRTVWVGGVAKGDATEDSIKEKFAASNPLIAAKIESVKCRVKEGANKCWALVTFRDTDCVQTAISLGGGALPWKVAAVESAKMKSLQAQFVQLSHQVSEDSCRAEPEPEPEGEYEGSGGT